MIALCVEHAPKADNGAFTDDQLRELKRVGVERAKEVRGQFDWMRDEILVRVGGSYFYQQDRVFEVGTQPVIWFNRDDDGYLLLNFVMPKFFDAPRATIVDNFWSIAPDVKEVICPPSGRLIDIDYGDGDRFRAEFLTLKSQSEALDRFPDAQIWISDVTFPLTVVELAESTANPIFQFDRDQIRIGTNVFLGGSFAMRNTAAGMRVDVSPADQVFLFPITATSTAEVNSAVREAAIRSPAAAVLHLEAKVSEALYDLLVGTSDAPPTDEISAEDLMRLFARRGVGDETANGLVLFLETRDGVVNAGAPTPGPDDIVRGLEAGLALFESIMAIEREQ